MIKKSAGEHLFNVFNIIFMTGLIIATLYPLLYVLFASLSDPATLAQSRGILLHPLGFTLEAYQRVFENPSISTGYRNTLFYVMAGTAINLIMTSLGAYALSRRNVMWRRQLTLLIVFTMFFSGGLIPTFLLVSRTLNMLNTPWALLVPTAINTWNLLVLKTAFESVPISLEEAARLDGANDFTILWRIVIPLSLPALAVIFLFYAVGHWNAYFHALIYLRDRELYPLQLVLREILIVNDTNSMTTGVTSGDVADIGETIKYATIVVATLPILLLYPFLQRYFVKGVLIGAVKE
ncbi:MAG: carbohydrate ABC transporter permease [Chloroflexi bacterium AL-W]|nr:carbohydrate ABC transporter permease [Chloroflexi bacterium AL-N1]NOK69386.1 carbohydrate ABC transporter permease [Chloroflexi bacterium AL-N10]NOK76447.1 carbohydrate ABC transporter permease [Chloroflexi bacterium AL-N5]NOK83564.1 carbohydrate ABC transporter permease [Chloroflexi bacterium AL-W]NOK91224.1 carbohydrate ABC transporter permease [Chloroflexi bacterium AL-N15]